MFRGVLAAAAAFVACAPASAEVFTIDFEPGTYTVDVESENYHRYFSHGVEIELFGAINNGVLDVEGGMAFRAGPYTINSIDLRGPADVSVRVDGNEIANLAASAGFTTFGPYVNSGTSIIFTTDPSQNFSIDNVVIDRADPAAPIPEPATWAMMIAGFGAIGLRTRRRNPIRQPS